MIGKLIILIYLFLFIITYGMALANLEGKSSDCRRHIADSLYYSILTPISTIKVFLATDFAKEGLQFTCKEVKE